MHSRVILAISLVLLLLAGALFWRSTQIGTRADPLAMPVDSVSVPQVQDVPVTTDSSSSRDAIAEAPPSIDTELPERTVEKEDWLLERRFGEPQTTAYRLDAIKQIHEQFKNGTGMERYSSAYLAATYSVATILDWQGRTAPPSDVPTSGAAEDEWEVGTMQANYVFPKSEFPAYTETYFLYFEKPALDSLSANAQSQTSDAYDRLRARVKACSTPFPAEVEQLVDDIVKKATDLLIN
jgi:hypothetical protein